MASNTTSAYNELPVLSVNELKPSGKTGFAATVALLIFACLTVGLRFATRIGRQRSFDIGDVWLMIGLCFFGGYCFALIRGLQTSGGGLAQDEFTPWGIHNFFKYLYAIEITFTATITAVKISLLCLYISIFRTRNFLRSARIVIGLCVIWFIVFMSVVIFQCNPVHAVWDMDLVATGKATCIPFGRMIIGYETTNMAIDVVILSLPLFVIKSLQLPRTRKYACACLFSLGGLILIVCVFRTYYLARVTNSSADTSFSKGLNWSTAELATAIMCASVPTYGHYFNSVGKAYSRLSSKLRSGHQAAGSDREKLEAVSPRGHIIYASRFVEAKNRARDDNVDISTDSSISYR